MVAQYHEEVLPVFKIPQKYIHGPLQAIRLHAL